MGMRLTEVVEGPAVAAELFDDDFALGLKISRMRCFNDESLTWDMVQMCDFLVDTTYAGENGRKEWRGLGASSGGAMWGKRALGRGKR